MRKDELVKKVKEVAAHLSARSPERKYRIDEKDSAIIVNELWLGVKVDATTGERSEGWVPMWEAIFSGLFFEVTVEPDDVQGWERLSYFLGLVVIS